MENQWICRQPDKKPAPAKNSLMSRRFPALLLHGSTDLVLKELVVQVPLEPRFERMVRGRPADGVREARDHVVFGVDFDGVAAREVDVDDLRASRQSSSRPQMGEYRWVGLPSVVQPAARTWSPL